MGFSGDEFVGDIGFSQRQVIEYYRIQSHLLHFELWALWEIVFKIYMFYAGKTAKLLKLLIWLPTRQGIAFSQQALCKLCGYSAKHADDKEFIQGPIYPR